MSELDVRLTEAQKEALRRGLEWFKPDLANHEAETLRLAAVAGVANRGNWAVLPRSTQRMLLSFMVARLRRLQDEVKYAHPRIDEAFSAFSAYSRRDQPGFVRGLSREHRPATNSWLEDADQWEGLLRELLKD